MIEVRLLFFALVCFLFGDVFFLFARVYASIPDGSKAPENEKFHVKDEMITVFKWIKGFIMGNLFTEHKVSSRIRLIQ